MAKKVGKLARRYAKAFLSTFETATHGASDTPAQGMAQSLLEFATIWENDEELSLFFLNPTFGAPERIKVMNAVADGAGLGDSAKQFLRVLIERDRIGLLPEIAAAFSELADEAAGVIQVSVVTAKAVERAEQEDIERQVQDALSGNPVFAWQVDPTLIGGMKIQYGGSVIDGSVTGRLGRLERELSH